jgi:hypothetical protein
MTDDQSSWGTATQLNKEHLLSAEIFLHYCLLDTLVSGRIRMGYRDVRVWVRPTSDRRGSKSVQ